MILFLFSFLQRATILILISESFGTLKALEEMETN
jgi:hypothetical protein